MGVHSDFLSILQDIIGEHGNPAKLAARLGVESNLITRWQNQQRAPNLSTLEAVFGNDLALLRTGDAAISKLSTLQRERSASPAAGGLDPHGIPSQLEKLQIKLIELYEENRELFKENKLLRDERDSLRDELALARAGPGKETCNNDENDLQHSA